MSASHKQLVADIRRVWSPPGHRPWSLGDVAIMKLLKAIEDGPDDPGREALEAAARHFETVPHHVTANDGHMHPFGKVAADVLRALAVKR